MYGDVPYQCNTTTSGKGPRHKVVKTPLVGFIKTARCGVDVPASLLDYNTRIHMRTARVDVDVSRVE